MNKQLIVNVIYGLIVLVVVGLLYLEFSHDHNDHVHTMSINPEYVRQVKFIEDATLSLHARNNTLMLMSYGDWPFLTKEIFDYRVAL